MQHETDTDVMTDALVIDCELEEAPDKVWRALTEPGLLARWLLPETPEAGRQIACEPLAADPPHSVSYRWRVAADAVTPEPLDSIVTFTLAETIGGGTHLRIVHSGFPLVTVEPMMLLAANTNEPVAMRCAA